MAQINSKHCPSCGHNEGGGAPYVLRASDCAMCYNGSMWIEPLVYNKELNNDDN